MTEPTNVGILAVGAYLPDEVRKNDWWPRSTVESWEDKLSARNNVRKEAAAPLTDGPRRVLAAMAEYSNDPFKGSKERRAMSKQMVPSDMEIAAGKDALQRSGIDPQQIDLLLTFSQLPDYVAVPNAPIVHAGLGLNEWCLSIATDSACNSFQTQLTLAESMIKSGRARLALLVQSSSAQHLIRPHEQHSAWFGDGATAVVVGPVAAGHGILGTAHRTDGTLSKALVGGCPNGGRWFDGGQIAYYFESREQAVRMTMALPELGTQVMDKALAIAGLTPKDVGFYASHQGTHWFRRVTQEHLGMAQARFFDSYEFTTSLAASNIPFVMAMASREGILRNGDVVAMFSGGSGISVSGTILRWGTGS